MICDSNTIFHPKPGLSFNYTDNTGIHGDAVGKHQFLLYAHCGFRSKSAACTGKSATLLVWQSGAGPCLSLAQLFIIFKVSSFHSFLVAPIFWFLRMESPLSSIL
jgi:hypothetical protein